jgi:hypothetical protein
LKKHNNTSKPWGGQERADAACSLVLTASSTLFACFLILVLIAQGCGAGKDPLLQEQVGDITPKIEQNTAEPTASDNPENEIIASAIPYNFPGLKRYLIHEGRELLLTFGIAAPAASETSGSAPAAEKHSLAALYERLSQGGGLFKMLITDKSGELSDASDKEKKKDALWVLIMSIVRQMNDIKKYLDLGVVGSGSRFIATEVLLEIRRIEAETAAGESVTLVDFGETGKKIDFVALTKGSFADFGSFRLKEGAYIRMKMILGSQHEIEVIDGTNFFMLHKKPLGMIPKSRTVIDLVEMPFEVKRGELVTLQVDMDLKHSIKRESTWKEGYSYRFVPIIKSGIVQSGLTVARDLKAAEGGRIEIVGAFSLDVPAGALAADTRVSVRPLSDIVLHRNPQLLMAGTVYEVWTEPKVALASPFRITMIADPALVTPLNLAQGNISLYSAAQRSELFAPLASQHEGEAVAALVQSEGLFALGGEPEYLASSSAAACGTLLGFDFGFPLVDPVMDPNYLSPECHNLLNCFRYGARTYGRSAAECLSLFSQAMGGRCDQLCENAGAESGCRAIDPQQAEIPALYGSCTSLAAILQFEASQKSAELYKDSAASECGDYENQGVSCLAPQCELSVDKSEIASGVPSDLIFTLTVQGSVKSVDFDSSRVYAGAAPYLPMEETFTIRESNRTLTEPKEYVASILGLASAEPLTCRVTVNVTQPEPPPPPDEPPVPPPPACTLAIDEATHLITLSVQPEWGEGATYVDIRGEGRYSQVALSERDPQGLRYFNTYISSTNFRTYSAIVANSAGEAFICSIIHDK